MGLTSPSPGSSIRQAPRTIRTTHHESPLVITDRGGAMAALPGPVVNHTDDELTLLESLVGREPPFAGMPFPNPATMFATLDPAEVERKIGELKVIENWLQMSLNLMQMSIKTLELQKASLEALRAAQPPVVRVAPGLWASSTAGSVTAGNDGVRVDLGVWNGEHRAATLTTAGEIQIERQRVPIMALGRTDCALVAESLEACATSTNCRSFASSARRIPQRDWTRLTRIYHEKTGLNAAAYRSLCMRSCELGLTPSAAFIRENACSGAQRGQWAAQSPAAGLLGDQG
jgi:hypothetical protein